MPRLPFFAALAFCAGAACVAPGIAAAQPVTVTFPANAHWAQEVDTITSSNLQQSYSVAIETGKILQVNLVTRNPNLFFKVKDTTSGKDLVDTYKTGATTWSTPAATAPTTYVIDVYAQTGVMQYGDTAKYALQIGQYGKSDMQAPTTAVQFEEGKPWVQTTGTLDAQGTAQDYTVAIDAGQTLAVNLVSNSPKVHFKVEDKTSGQTLVDSASSNVTSWSAPVSAASNFTVTVYTDPAGMLPGSKVGYALQIGRYAQGAAPAAATSGGGAPVPTTSATGPAAAASAHD